ncbi:MAG: hypothetical protein CMM50_18555 [Rhodospirillaceae bacterium]|nr:hypothetical protein [Rhodospirillaceae bacterium]
MQNWAIAIPWLLSILTIAVGGWQFWLKVDQANKEPFLRKQLELAFEASEVAAQLATTTDPETWEEARQGFWKLYWGPLAIVEDRDVEAAMVRFSKVIPDEPAAQITLPVDKLRVPSLELAHATRDLILESWNVKLAPLEGMGK